MNAELRQQAQLSLTGVTMPRLASNLLLLNRQQLSAQLSVLAEQNPLIELPEPGGMPRLDPPGITLAEHVAEQLAYTPLDKLLRADALRCLSALDQRGYLPNDRQLAKLAQLPLMRSAAASDTIRQLSPIGVGARSLVECLTLQLDALSPQTEAVRLARRIINEHNGLFRQRDLRRLAPERQLASALAVLRSLQPRFANSFAAPAKAVIPDLEVRKSAGVWQIFPLARAVPFELSADAARLRDTSKIWRALNRQAHRLRDALEFRHATLLKVAQAMVDRQRAFFFEGNAALTPLGLSDIAATVGLSVSTISASIHSKYFAHAGKSLALKFLLQRNTCPTHPLAATALQEMLKHFIATEKSSAPLTDQHLMLLLHECGYPLARRTVTKHRIAANIIPSFLRRQDNLEPWKFQ